MNYIYPITELELGIVSLSTSILLISAIVHLYIYLKLREKAQLYILYINLVLLAYAVINTVLMCLAISNLDLEIILRMSSIGQIIISYTALVWILYTEEVLALNKRIKFIIPIIKIILIPALVLITIIAFTMPNLFTSIDKPIWTALEGIRGADIVRGEIGIFYIIRDIYVVVIAILIFIAFSYEIIINKNIKGNLLFMISFLIYIVGGVDEVVSVYTGRNFVFENVVFPRTLLSSAILCIMILYLSTEKFINTTFIINKTKSILTGISNQQNNIFDSATEVSYSILDTKHKVKIIISNFYNISSDLLRSMGTLKYLILKSIECSEEFKTSTSSQINDINTNMKHLKSVKNNFPNIKDTIDRQKEGLATASEYIENSIENMYSLQFKAKELTEYSLVFKNKTTEIKDKIQTSTNQIESFSQIFTQIRRIIIFMNNISDKTKILAINSGIQASKSGDWSYNFAVVSEEISELVEEMLSVTEKLEKLLSNIDNTFKDFYLTKDSVLSSFKTLVENTEVIENDIQKVSDDISLQNDYNISSLKNIHKLLSLNYNVETLLVKENNFCEMAEDILLYLREILTDIESKSINKTEALKNLASDINKVSATSHDLKAICSELNDNLENFDSVATNLKNKTLEYN